MPNWEWCTLRGAVGSGDASGSRGILLVGDATTYESISSIVNVGRQTFLEVNCRK